eukprot:Skav218774  [mRNA]  locus=scaffold1372:364986:366563:- [translate_table: standard]
MTLSPQIWREIDPIAEPPKMCGYGVACPGMAEQSEADGKAEAETFYKFQTTISEKARAMSELKELIAASENRIEKLTAGMPGDGMRCSQGWDAMPRDAMLREPAAGQFLLLRMCCQSRNGNPERDPAASSQALSSELKSKKAQLTEDLKEKKGTEAAEKLVKLVHWDRTGPSETST